MPQLMLTSALLFALLAVVAIAIGASLGIARDLMLDDADDTATAADTTPAYSGRNGNGLTEDFRLGLHHHAAHFAQDSSPTFQRGRSCNARI